MRSHLLSLCLGALIVLSATAKADGPHRITLDGLNVSAADDAKLHVPGKPDPDQRPQNPLLELYPTTIKPSKGTIMISPGGGYTHLAENHEGRNVARTLNDAGWDAAVLFYHVDAGPDTRVLALEDARKALALLQIHGSDFGLSTRLVGAMGFSAGGHLTLRLAHEASVRGKAPAFLILIYPAYLEKNGELLEEVSPINAPTFLCVGEQDKHFFPSAMAYEQACQKHNIACETFVAKGAGHGFGIRPNLPGGAIDWPDRLKAFVDSLSLDNRPPASATEATMPSQAPTGSGLSN